MTFDVRVWRRFRRKCKPDPLQARIATLRAEVMKRPSTGLDADKAFYDELSDEGFR